MGVMIEGVYHRNDPEPDTSLDGEFKRKKATLRHWITRDGSAGPTGSSGFAAEPNRYHLFVAWNCPWAHRTLLARTILGLENSIGISVARPRRTEEGWVFDSEGEFFDAVLSAQAVHETYSAALPKYTGRITVPVLWDKGTSQPVSNESADIVRMLNSAFDHEHDLFPERHRAEIDQWNQLIYEKVNNGVYRAGFATSQQAYEAAAIEVFDVLDKVETHLETNRYLCGSDFTEADLRLFPTLARFDVAYHYAFKCNIRRLIDYPNLWAYARDIYQMPGVAETVRFDIYKQGYFSPSELRNPLGIVPVGPKIDWDVAHRRG